MSVTLLVRVEAKPGHGSAISEFVKPVPAENDIEGCQGMDVFTNAANPDEVLILEHWTSIKAHKTFLAGLMEQGALDEMLGHAADVTRTYFVEAPG